MKIISLIIWNSKLGECNGNFEGPTCDRCKPGYSGTNCDKKATCTDIKCKL